MKSYNYLYIFPLMIVLFFTIACQHKLTLSQSDILKKQCNKQDAAACNNLGVIETQMENQQSAMEYYTKACDLDFAMACSNLGYLVEQSGNPREAKSLYKKACDGNNMGGCHNFAMMEEEAGNISIAKTFYEKACNDNYSGSCLRLRKIEKAQLSEKIRAKYKYPLCSNSQLFEVIYYPFGESVESNCIYHLNGPLKVLQVLENGILVTLVEPMRNLQDKTIFIRVSPKYVDNELLKPMYVKYSGIMSTSFRTIHSFQYIDDVTITNR